jgi:hypothetical protein
VGVQGCQDYEFNPLRPVTFRQATQFKKVVAQPLKPNLMLMVDRSDSMGINNLPPGCVKGGAQPCKSRWDALKEAMNAYLDGYKTPAGRVARLGMVMFPSGIACEPGSSAKYWVDLQGNDDGAALQAQAEKIRAIINDPNTVPGGGTPAKTTLEMLGNYPPLNDPLRENIIVYETDGLPNCNPKNDNRYGSSDCGPAIGNCDCNFAPPSQCGTQPPLADPSKSGYCCSGCPAPSSCYSTDERCRLGCMDTTGVLSTVHDLYTKKGIKVAVVGLAEETGTGTAPDIMNAIATEGHAPRICPNGTDDECGFTNACNRTTKVCEPKKYYQANTAQELADALKRIGYDLAQSNVCSYQLEIAPPDATFVSVMVDGRAQQTGSDTWKYDAGVVTFVGAMCGRLKASTPTDPVQLEFRTLDVL